MHSVPSEVNSIQAVEQAIAWASAQGYTVEPYKQQFIIRVPCPAAEATCFVMRKPGEHEQWYRMSHWVKARFVELMSP